MASPSAPAPYSVCQSASRILAVDSFQTNASLWAGIGENVPSDEGPFQFRFELYPNGFPNGVYLFDTDYVYICLHNNAKSPASWIQLDVSLIDVNGERQLTQVFCKPSSQLEEEYLCSRFCSRVKILASPSTLLHAGTLKVLFEVWAFKEGSTPLLPTLSADFASLLASGTFSDVTLVVGGKDFPVHKAILSARSPVFARMFAGEFKESKESRVVLEEADEQAFKQLLNFIYTEKIDNLPENASGLLIAAEKYQMEALRDFCGHYLATTLTTDNLLSVLQLAYLHNATQLQGKCLAFLKQHLPQFKQTQDWKQLIMVKGAVNQELLGLLFQTVLDTVDL